jgi:hypothetical protein
MSIFSCAAGVSARVARDLRATRALALIFATTSLTLAAGAQAQTPADYHAMWAQAPIDAAVASRAVALARDSYRVTVHPRLGIPTFLQPTERLARGRPPLSLSGPENAARAALRDLAPAYRITRAEVDRLTVANTQRLANGAAIVQFVPKIDGIDVFNERASVLMDADGSLRAIGGYAASTSSIAAGQARSLFLKSADQALSAALSEHFASDAIELQAQSDTPDAAGYLRFNAAIDGGHADLLRAKPVFFRLPQGLVPAYYLETSIAEGTSSHVWGYVVSAKDGSLLLRQSLTHDADFSYRVWADAQPPHTPYIGPQGRGGIPHPTGTPNGFQPPFIAPDLITLQNGSISTNDAWLAPGAAETLGNNVDAYADRSAPDGFGGLQDTRASTTAANTFDRVYDVLLAPAANSTQVQAAVTQLFYVNNWLHDWYYDAGFDEASGNAQADNYGRGGIEGDVLLVEAQDYSGTDNANMSTPADGSSPRMQMYVFTGTAPNRDGTIDNGIVAHEWGHYISYRMIPSLFGSQGAGMSEGLGDFHAMLMIVREGDDVAAPSNADFGGAYSAAGYALGGAAGNQSFYYGIRRYPYSTAFSRNPLTFGHIATGAPLPAGPPIQMTYSSPDNAEVHNVGEVWANMLWSCYAGLLADDARLSFVEAQDRMTRYLVGSYKMSPPSPTFVDARDALLSVIASQDADDFRTCAQAFAARGLGSGAIAPDVSDDTNAGVVESFVLDPDVHLTGLTADDQPQYCDADGYLDAGETGQLNVRLRNNGLADSVAGTVTLSTAVAGVSFPSGAAFALPALAPTAETVVKVPVSLTGANAMQTIEFDVAIVAGAFNATPSAAIVAHVDYVPQGASTEDFESPTLRWDTLTESGAGEDNLWSRRETVPGEHAAFGPDLSGPGVTWLISPPLPHAPGTPLSFTLRHRYSFEYDGTVWDGGLIEISTDDGQNWVDLETYTSAVHYDGTLTGISQNPLAGRRVFSNASAGYPAFVDRIITLDDLPGPAGEVRVRFGIATDAAAGGPGWEIDNIAFAGLSGLPFELTRDDQGLCLQVETVSGTPQSAVPGAAFALPLSARVVGADDVPRAGVEVTFDAPPAGASGTFAGDDNTVTVTTGIDGIATSPVFTANASVGDYIVLASAGLQDAGFALDNAAPSGSVPVLDAVSDTGRFDDDRITNAPQPDFTGTCSAADSVTLIVDGADVASAACAGGTYVVGAPIAAGVHAVAVRFSLAATQSAATATIQVTIDRTAAAPAAPVVAGSGSAAVQVSGTGVEPLAEVIVEDGAVEVCSTLANNAGVWSCNGNVAGAGGRTLTATQIDVAGNESAASAGSNYAVSNLVFRNGFEN